MDAVPDTVFRADPKNPDQIAAWVLGLLLLAAAVAKLMSGGVPSDSGVAMKSSWAGEIVCYEMFLGLWLVSGIGNRWSLRTVAMTFLVFAGATLWMVAHGTRECGCFGAVSVSPKVTYWIDVAAWTAAVHAILGKHKEIRIRVLPALLSIAAAAFAASLVIAPSHPSPQAIEAGMSWPPARTVDLAADLSKGRWVVLLYDSSCHRCESLAAGYEEDASGWEPSGKECKLALLDVNNAEHPETALASDTIVRGRLLMADLYPSSPIVLFLDQGRVLKVQDAWENRGIPDPRNVFPPQKTNLNFTNPTPGSQLLLPATAPDAIASVVCFETKE